MQFERVWGQQHHDHLICMGCEKKVEFSYPAIEVLQDAVAKEHGFALTGHNLELLGFCPSCQEKSLEDAVSCLIDLKKGTIAKVVRLSGGKALINRLHSFGLHDGQVIRVARFAPFRGPILIEDVKNQSKMMIARRMAEYVMVEEINSGE
jgi:Fe2+ transport system protein FeoA